MVLHGYVLGGRILSDTDPPKTMVSQLRFAEGARGPDLHFRESLGRASRESSGRCLESRRSLGSVLPAPRFLSTRTLLGSFFVGDGALHAQKGADIIYPKDSPCSL